MQNLWQKQEHELLLERMLPFLDNECLLRWSKVEHACSKALLRVKQRFHRRTARFALAHWLQQHLRVEFQSYYQVLETQRIPRSSDPRVPPKVVSIWTEQGKVDGGLVSLEGSTLPLVHSDGFTMSFAPTAASSNNKKPMLTNVVRNNRRIYTVVTVTLTSSRHRQNATDDVEESKNVVLRRYAYLKEFGEWQALNLMEKRALDIAKGANCRYDLITQDGSLVLELDIPKGADALMDYYLVTKGVVFVHINELFQQLFQTVRPLSSLPAPGDLRECVISLSFRGLQGIRRSACIHISGQLVIEEQQQDTTDLNAESGQSPSTSSRRRTGMERFDIITCKYYPRAASSSANRQQVFLPDEPGYLWLRAWDRESKRIYFHAVMLHHGGKVARGVKMLETKWLPGTLEYYPTPSSRHRRCLKGRFHVSTTVETGQLQELVIIAQHLRRNRLAQYAATLNSYTRTEA